MCLARKRSEEGREESAGDLGRTKALQSIHGNLIHNLDALIGDIGGAFAIRGKGLCNA
jgi:hypothetical protein